MSAAESDWWRGFRQGRKAVHVEDIQPLLESEIVRLNGIAQMLAAVKADLDLSVDVLAARLNAIATAEAEQ